MYFGCKLKRKQTHSAKQNTDEYLFLFFNFSKFMSTYFNTRCQYFKFADQCLLKDAVIFLKHLLENIMKWSVSEREL